MQRFFKLKLKTDKGTQILGQQTNVAVRHEVEKVYSHEYLTSFADHRQHGLDMKSPPM